MTVTAEIGATPWPELIKKVQAGDEIVLTQDDKPVAKLVPAKNSERPVSSEGFRIRSFSDHRVLTPVISAADLADEMLGGK